MSALQDDALVALAAVELLHELGGELSHAATAVLERPEPELVREAVRCLGAAGGETVLASLLPLVSHADWSVRAEAIGVLAERRFARAAPAILGLLDSERDEFVRDAILHALERLEG
jgi:HEAT repeat protein